MKQIRTAAIATLGCKLNQSESDRIATQLADAGVQMVPFGRAADLYVVNSCTVTHIGDRKSRQLIRQAARANPGAFIAVAGCYAELEPEALSAIDGVGAVVGNKSKDRLLDTLRARGLTFGKRDGKDGFALTPPTSTPPTPRTRAFVKIQEGCDNACSYCIVPKARGHGHSVALADVVTEVRRLVAEGYQEVVLTGVNITAYGRDHGYAETAGAARGMGLIRLIEAILEQTEIPRVRLSSLQPEDWSPRYHDLWGSGRLCRHLHLSLQSGSDSVLRRMRRRYNSSQYAHIVEEVRGRTVDVAFTTDLIAGFPEETDAEHEETEAFLRRIGFAGLHVFKYSPRSGTPASMSQGQVDPRTKQERSDRLITLADQMSLEFRSRLEGSVLAVLWEEPVPETRATGLGLEARDGRIWWTGLSDNYVRVYAPGDGPLRGTISGARIGAAIGDGVLGALMRPQFP